MQRERIEFRPETDAEIFAAIAAVPAVFLLRGEDGSSEPYVSKTANLRRRLQRLLSAPEERTKRLNLRARVRWIEFTLTGSDFESGSNSGKRRAPWSSCIWKTNFPAPR